MKRAPLIPLIASMCLLQACAHRQTTSETEMYNNAVVAPANMASSANELTITEGGQLIMKD